MTDTATLPALLTTQELADYLGIPVRTIYAWNYQGDGPPRYKVGRHVRYRRTDVEEWLENQKADRSL